MFLNLVKKVAQRYNFLINKVFSSRAVHFCYESRPGSSITFTFTQPCSFFSNLRTLLKYIKNKRIKSLKKWKRKRLCKEQCSSRRKCLNKVNKNRHAKIKQIEEECYHWAKLINNKYIPGDRNCVIVMGWRKRTFHNNLKRNNQLAKKNTFLSSYWIL